MLFCYMCGNATEHGKGFVFSRPDGVPYWLLMKFKTPFFYEADGKICEGRAGELLLNSPGTPLVHGAPEKFDGGFCNDWIYFSGDEADKIVKELEIPVNRAFSAERYPEISDVIERISKESNDRTANASYMSCGLLYLMLAGLGRAIVQNAYSDASSGAFADVKRAHDEMLRDCGRAWTLSDMAELSGYSVSRFCAIYKKLYGASPVDDLIKSRIDRARYLLLAGEHNVSETAELCGFSSLHYFSSAFKKFTGYPPSKFAGKDKPKTDETAESLDVSSCKLCPRECGVNRLDGERGICGESAEIRVSRISLHPYEEPAISGKRGAGTIFFCGCSLGCVYCQNKAISRGECEGQIMTPEELARAMLDLQEKGAACIDLVTPTHFSRGVAAALRLVKNKLNIPVVYNTSGYERVQTLKALDGLVDVYMPDFKYASAELAAKYSAAPDYCEVAERALAEMYRQTGKYKYSSDKTLTRGVLIRHLVLPACRKDSIEVLHRIAKTVPAENVLLSLMSQYTPDFALDTPHKELHRRITRFEYDSVLSVAEELGFDGFVQHASSASAKYTPDFVGGEK